MNFNKPVLGLMSLILILTSCERVGTESAKEPKLISVSIRPDYDVISIDTTPMTKSDNNDSKDLLGVVIYAKKTGEANYTKYAYGLFDNSESMTITLADNAVYKFVCHEVRENDTHVKTYVSGGKTLFYLPFEGLSLTNEFVMGEIAESKLQYFNTTTVNSGVDWTNSPSAEVFYGEIAGYKPTEGGKVIIPMKSNIYAVEYNIVPPPDGYITVTGPGISSRRVSSSDEKLSTGKILNTLPTGTTLHKFVSYSDGMTQYDTEELSYDKITSFPLDRLLMFSKVNVMWTRSSGATQSFERDVIVIENYSVAMNISVSGSNVDTNVGLNYGTSEAIDKEVTINMAF